MNKLERIEEMEKQLAALRVEVEKDQKPKKWEPKGGDWVINGKGETTRSSYLEDEYILDGTTRETKEAAQKAAREITRFKRLLAYRDEFAPDYEFRMGEDNFYVINDHGVFKMFFSTHVLSVGVVYMPADVVRELCRKLNRGEVVL